MRLSNARFAIAVCCALALHGPAALAQQAAAPAASAPAAAGPTFTKEQLDQLLAPIALYPDSLLSQILMAATYPADVADAAKWVKANPNQKGDAAVKAVEPQTWDPSVKSLAAFPQVLDLMGAKPDWVQSLGDAFLASSKDTLDSVQRLRAQAQKAGNLKSSEQQKVVVEQAPQTTTTVIKIEPSNPEVVYVPAYNPTVVYGVWAYPAYPPFYYPPPPMYYPGTAFAAGIAFGLGVATVNALWGNCNWGHGDVNINVNRYNNVNVNKINANQTNFQHNADNRRGVPYRDAKSQQQFGKNVSGANQRADYRGRDATRDAQRQQAQSTLQNRGMDPAREREQLRNDPATRERAQAATQGGGRDLGGSRDASSGSRDLGGGGGGNRPQASTQQARGNSDHAFRGASNPAQASRDFDRGSASRQSMSRPAGGGGGGRRR